VRARDAEHLETGVLGREERSAADGADFDGGHGDGDEEVLSVVGAGREARWNGCKRVSLLLWWRSREEMGKGRTLPWESCTSKTRHSEQDLDR
jgi:hypothetical protein